MVDRVHAAAATGFQRSAPAYERGRPDYPPEAIDWLAAEVGLRRGRTVVDLAAGTGKLARLLVPTGAHVIAVEPVEAMWAALVEIVPGVPVVGGTAQAIPLRHGSADVVAIAQAFHWFAGAEALTEIHRVVVQGGWLALVWNRRELNDPVQQEISRIIDPYRGDTPSYRTQDWRTPLRETPLFREANETAFPNQQITDVDGLVDRVVSTSFIAVLSGSEQRKVVSALQALAQLHGGTVVLRYRTEIQLFRRI